MCVSEQEDRITFEVPRVVIILCHQKFSCLSAWATHVDHACLGLEALDSRCHIRDLIYGNMLKIGIREVLRKPGTILRAVTRL